MTLSAWSLGMEQTATYWAPLARDGVGGRTFSPPVAVTCRWQDETVKFIGNGGEEFTSSAVIYSDRVLANSGMIALGEYDDSAPVASAREIRGVKATPGLFGTEQLNKVYV